MRERLRRYVARKRAIRSFVKYMREGRPPDRGCKLPPKGWYCSLAPGHDGPCPARQVW